MKVESCLKRLISRHMFDARGHKKQHHHRSANGNSKRRFQIESRTFFFAFLSIAMLFRSTTYISLCTVVLGKNEPTRNRRKKGKEMGTKLHVVLIHQGTRNGESDEPPVHTTTPTPNPTHYYQYSPMHHCVCVSMLHCSELGFPSVYSFPQVLKARLPTRNQVQRAQHKSFSGKSDSVGG